MTIAWPSVLKARMYNPHLRNFAKGGGPTLTGRQQRSFQDAGFWEIVVDQIAVRNREQAAAYRAMIAKLRQGEEILLPVCDRYKAIGAREEDSQGVFKNQAIGRATQFDLTITGVDPQPGHYLTIGDRLYLATDIIAGPDVPPLLNPVVNDAEWHDDEPWTDDTPPHADYSLRVLPPARQLYAVDTVVKFRDLQVRCVLKDLADGDLELDIGRGFPTLTFVESI